MGGSGGDPGGSGGGGLLTGPLLMQRLQHSTRDNPAWEPKFVPESEMASLGFCSVGHSPALIQSSGG